MKNCIFCKIVKKDVPSDIVYEDENALAFLDIDPVHKGHTLVIPKKHSINIFDILESDFLDVMKIVRKLSQAIKEGVQADGLNIAFSNEKAANQDVPHLHVHIMPRYKNDNYKFGFPRIKYSDGESKEIAEKIKSSLN